MRSAQMLYVILLVAGCQLQSHQTADVPAIEAATARYAMAHFVEGAVAIDTTNAFMRAGGQPTSTRSAAELAQLSRILNGAKIGALSDFRICPRPDNANACEMRGTDAVVSMSRPAIEGDTAVVMIRIFSAHRLPTGQTFSGARSERIQVERRGSRWVATKVLPGGSVS